jgi:hypothetical protein
MNDYMSSVGSHTRAQLTFVGSTQARNFEYPLIPIDRTTTAEHETPINTKQYRFSSIHKGKSKTCGLYELNRMRFCLQNAVAAFQRMMDIELPGFQGTMGVFVCINYIVVHTGSLERYA